MDRFEQMVNQAIALHPGEFQAFDKTKDIQEQLQEMIPYHDNLGNLFLKFHYWACRTGDYIVDCYDNVVVGRNEIPMSPYRSMEQLWMGFVMHEVFKERWGENMWVKYETESN